MASARQRWDVLWLTLFPLALAGLGDLVLPRTPSAQLAFFPLWTAYWILTRGRRTGLWIALWCGLLAETLWGAPPAGALIPFLAFWGAVQGLRVFREEPFAPTSLTGLILGTALVPVLRLWIWAWAVLWHGAAGAAGLRFGWTACVAAPAAGAAGGCLVFALAQRWDFLALRPFKREAAHGDY